MKIHPKENPNIKMIPVEEAIKPKDQHVALIDRWWIVVDNCIMIYADFAPQCNRDKRISEKIQKKIYPMGTVEQIPMVFINY